MKTSFCLHRAHGIDLMQSLHCWVPPANAQVQHSVVLNALMDHAGHFVCNCVIFCRYNSVVALPCGIAFTIIAHAQMVNLLILDEVPGVYWCFLMNSKWGVQYEMNGMSCPTRSAPWEVLSISRTAFVYARYVIVYRTTAHGSHSLEITEAFVLKLLLLSEFHTSMYETRKK